MFFISLEKKKHRDLKKKNGGTQDFLISHVSNNTEIELPIIHTVDNEIMKEKKCQIYTISLKFCVIFFPTRSNDTHSGSVFRVHAHSIRSLTLDFVT